jgi:uncharacterized membrane protein
MKKWVLSALVAVALAVAGGLVYAQTTATAKSFTCPLTGEELPCPDCCPLNCCQ